MSVLIGIGFFVVVRYVIPNLPIDWGLLENAVNKACAFISWRALVFLLPECLSIVRRTRGDKLLANNKTKQALHAMRLHIFEELIEAYDPNRGYTARQRLALGPDGGVNVSITNDRGDRTYRSRVCFSVDG